ncbi:DUF2264 domain-containing protein [Nocardiopsis suaedae]|uniref:DUF2264 domain-containing protein n=1 Tax=Nocardiopsis suaedae TaxID=3018444 RepID=A0ABT4TID5_9ACTN|nr:DUF2264 domain-containing protein [Nocardiopsis suaedae]MDA2804170.1 DUF2264 domain-containing protein [Nocardiopsis suaedae]
MNAPAPPALALPGEDRERSPRTGYTRAHWEATADGLLAAAWRHASPNGARLDLPGPPSRSGTRSDGLEGYARTFLAAAFRTAGADGADPHGWLERYADGLAAGTRAPGAADHESWPLVLDYDVQGQPMVEAASVALGLRLTRPWLWDRLDAGVRDRAEEWLRGALRSLPAPCNWYLFPYSVAGFLESVGRGDAETARARARALELLEEWYRGQGWYADGDGRAFDHYNGWAMHLYPVLDDHLSGASTGYGDRLREHLEGYALLFGGDGAPLHMGRSLTYRFAAAAPVALGAVTGHTPLSPGTSRRLMSGCLRYFLDRGAVGGDGLLTLGWHGPHAATVQPYSGPASPYWASKAFAGLLAPADHPLWTETERAAPSEGADRALALPAPGLLVQATGADGIVRVHNHGSSHLRPFEEEKAPEDPHYDRLAYSTRTGPTSGADPADNRFTVLWRGLPGARRRIRPLGAGQGPGWSWAASWHRPVFAGGVPALPALRVQAATVVRGAYELRVHRVVGAPEGTAAELTGWAVGADEPVESVLVPLYGWAGRDRVSAPAGTAFTPSARLPRLSGTVSGTALFAALALLEGASPARGGGEAAEGAEGAVSSVAEDGGALVVGWADGARTRVGFAPVRVEHEEAR